MYLELHAASAFSFLEGASPETIRDDFDRLNDSSTYGAISYYLDLLIR